ncbi:MAG: helix-turn-helix transcriptional regulator [Verrucomicrobiota bacterium]
MKRLLTYDIPLPHEWNAVQARLYWVYRGAIAGGRHTVHSRGPLGSLTVLRGTLNVRTERGFYRAKSGMSLLMPPGDRVYLFSSDIRVLSVAAELQWKDFTPVLSFPEILVLKGNDSLRFEGLGKQLLGTVHGGRAKSIDWNEALAFVPRDLPHHAAVQAHLWRWLESVAVAVRVRCDDDPSNPQPDPRVEKLLHLLHQAPFRNGLDVEAYARETGLSWRRLEQLFKKAMAKTPSEYYEHRRIWMAHRLLAAGDKSVKEVAFDLGFAHQSSFSRWFVTHYGMPPSTLLGHDRHSEKVRGLKP